jgi:hypothetical protein
MIRPAMMTTVAAIAMVLGVAPSSARAQQVGDSVTPTKNVELKVKDSVIATATSKDTLIVEKLGEGWLWVRNAEGKKGWVQAGDVQVVAAPQRNPPAGREPEPRRPATAATDEPPVDDRLYLIGAMGATQVYLTYAYVGAVGDGFVNKTYDAPKVQELMGEVAGMTDHLIKQLRKVRGGELTDDDRKAIDEMIDINVMLKKQAEALSAFSQDASDENAKSFEEVRTEVWPRISNLLGIKSPPAASESTATPPETGAN